MSASETLIVEAEVLAYRGMPAPVVPSCVSDRDWAQAFGYAGEPDQHGSANVRAVIGAAVPVTPFARRDVAYVVAKREGENDGVNWVCFGRLYDSRWFTLSAGCDYTGWDCQASGVALVAETAKQAVELGLSDDERSTLLLINEVEQFVRVVPAEW
jgi:hypothetical protein